MSKSTIRNMIIAVSFVLVAAAAFGFMVFKVNLQGSQLALHIDTLEKEQMQEASHLKLRRIAENSTTDRALLQSYFLSKESDSIDFLNRVETMAPQVGVVLHTSGLELVTDDADINWIKVEFSFAGSRDRVQRFIQILETFPLVSRLVSVDMSSRSGAEWQASVIMQVQVLSYDE